MKVHERGCTRGHEGEAKALACACPEITADHYEQEMLRHVVVTSSQYADVARKLAAVVLQQREQLRRVDEALAQDVGWADKVILIVRAREDARAGVQP